DLYFGIAISKGTAYVDWRGNVFDGSGNLLDQEQVRMASFQINGSLNVTVPNDGVAHTVTIDRVPGQINSITVLDNGVREYAGMGDYLNGITLHDANSTTDTVNIEKTYFHDNVAVNF